MIKIELQISNHHHRFVFENISDQTKIAQIPNLNLKRTMITNYCISFIIKFKSLVNWKTFAMSL